MSIWDYLAASPLAFTIAAAIVGLLVGSFLNVVIYRLPIMMERSWRSQCQELLSVSGDGAAPERFDLLVPRSRCPHCQRPFGAMDFVPLLSFFVLLGGCAGCGARLCLRFPVLELASGLL